MHAYHQRHDGWAGWCGAVLDNVAQQLQGPIFADGKIFTNTSKPHAPGTLFVPYLPAYNTAIKRLHDHFVITTADKLANNYVVVCKSYYIQQVWADLNGTTGFYSRLQPGLADPTPVNTRIIDDLLSKVTPVATGVPCMFTNTDTSTLREELSVIPYEAALVKLHKTPVALRFLACSAANGLRKPAVWLTCLFRAVHTDLQSCWSQLLASAHVPWHTDPAWYANKSTDVVDTVRRFNATNMHARQFVDGGGWHGYDVERLYTNIEITDLVDKLCRVLRWGGLGMNMLLMAIQLFWCFGNINLALAQTGTHHSMMCTMPMGTTTVKTNRACTMNALDWIRTTANFMFLICNMPELL
jgi:hypothetical protein